MGRRSSGKARKAIAAAQRPPKDTSYWTGGGIGSSRSTQEVQPTPAT